MLLQPSLLESPSLNTSHHSSATTLSEIAARVVEELRLDNEEFFDDVVFEQEDEQMRRSSDKGKEIVPQIEEGVLDADEEEESEFEFAVVTRDDDAESAISADEIFENGQIRPSFPLFNTDLIPGSTNWIDNRNRTSENRESSESVRVSNPVSSIRHPLSKLLIEEKAAMTASCSSSEADELDNLPPGTYCVWKPKSAEEEIMMRKKSNSTGSSKRWRLRELLRRSISDGKETFVFLAPRCESSKTKATEKPPEKGVLSAEVKRSVGGGGGEKKKKKKKKSAAAMAAQEEHYLKNRAARESDRRRSYLPYRRDLVGFFANVNGLSRAVQPF